MIDQGISDAKKDIENSNNGDDYDKFQDLGISEILMKHGREVNAENIEFYKDNVKARSNRYNEVQIQLKKLMQNI